MDEAACEAAVRSENARAVAARAFSVGAMRASIGLSSVF